MTIDVTYGILNYNPANDSEAEKHFVNCVKSLAENRSKDLKSEVYLIDQASQSSLTEELSRIYNFNAITLNENIGISRGINLLANIARGKYVSLVTSDTVFPKLLDIKLIDILERNADIFQVCSASYKSDIPYQRYEANKNTLIKCIAQELTIQFWPKTTFEKIGFFEEKFKATHENLDFALRVYINGGYAAIDHSSVCEHIHNMTTKNGSINKAYDGYLEMDGLDHQILRGIWNEKWPNLNWDYLYDPNILNEELRDLWQNAFWHNIYLPYIQEVGY